MLDTHSSLRLVTDVMHEDDALSLALTCHALHDTLWACFQWLPAHVGPLPVVGAWVRTA